MRGSVWFVALVAGCMPPEAGARYRVARIVIETGVYTRGAPARYADAPELVPPCDEAHPCEAAERRAPLHETATETGAASSDRASVIGGAARLEVLAGSHVYLGADLEVGGVRSTAADFTTTDSAIALGAAVFAGLTARTGRLQGSTELALGTQRIMRHSDAGDGWSWFFVDQRTFVEPRIRVDWWIQQHLSIGVYGVVDERGVHAGGLRLSGSIPALRQR